MSDNDPVAYMVTRNGEPCHVAWTIGDAKKERNRLELVSTGTPAIELFSLYRLPTLTAEERGAIEWCLSLPMLDRDAVRMMPLRSLLERLK